MRVDGVEGQVLYGAGDRAPTCRSRRGRRLAAGTFSAAANGILYLSTFSGSELRLAEAGTLRFDGVEEPCPMTIAWAWRSTFRLLGGKLRVTIRNPESPPHCYRIVLPGGSASVESGLCVMCNHGGGTYLFVARGVTLLTGMPQKDALLKPEAAPLSRGTQTRDRDSSPRHADWQWQRRLARRRRRGRGATAFRDWRCGTNVPSGGPAARPDGGGEAKFGGRKQAPFRSRRGSRSRARPYRASFCGVADPVNAMTHPLLVMILLLTTLSSLLPAQELAGPTPEVTPRAVVSPDRALAPGAGADTTVTNNRMPVQLSLTLSGYYDDNIYVQPRGPNRVSDYIWTVAPSISWSSSQVTGMENSFQLAYSPGFIFYQENPANNTVEQVGSFVYGYHGPRTDLVISQQYASVQNSAPDLGDLVNLEEYVTTANLDYALTSKLGLTLRAQQDITDYDDGLNSTQWTGSAYLNYMALPKTTFAMGALFGAADIEGPNQIFEQLNGRVLYTPTAKLSFNATAGVEFRQTQGISRDQVNPTFSLGLDYDPFDSTDLNLTAYREYAYSAKYFGDDYLATGAAVSVTQRFFQKFYTTLTGSYENAVYEDNLPGQATDLGYNYFSVRSALAFRPTTWCELSIYYQYRRNVSNTIDAFTDNQAGFQSRFSY